MKKILAVMLATVFFATAALAADDIVKTELKDGTHVEIDNGAVTIIAADHTRTPAPDGVHELADGTKLTVKDGKIIKE